MLLRQFGRSMSTAAESLCSTARHRLLEHETNRLSKNAYKAERPAAVLVPLFMNQADQKLSVLLTLRSNKLRHHSGEVACPGGRHEECDRDPVDTALREAREEIGMQPHQVEVLTQFPIFLARGRQPVVPVVGLVPENFQPAIQTSEVEAVFRAPLEMFLVNDPMHTSQDFEYKGKFLIMHSFDYKDPEHESRSFRIWGFTAQVLISVASIVFNRPPDFRSQLLHYSPNVPTQVGEKPAKEYYQGSKL